ncbi:phage tail spike protein [Bacillus sp. FJAT-45037]|uniref:phage tail spike protein n=1 Tax=Bacillus sp. FJAT-45037 TaxID=2011007 RepID=UPI000C2341D2|nr:phage tail spike protein [Bacillus sp. FJAT-45037]
MTKNITQVASTYIGQTERTEKKAVVNPIVHVLDYKTENIVATLENKEETAVFFEDVHTESLENNLETFDFNMQANVKEAEYVSKRNRIIIPGEDGFFREFIISETHQSSNKIKEVYSTASYEELAKQKVIDPVVLEGQTVNTSLDFALIGTEWTRGITEYAGARKLTLEDHTNPFKLLKQIATLFELELRFRVEIRGSRIVGRYVDLITKRGIDGKKEVELGKDLINITRKEKTDEIVTALVGIGPEREDGTRHIVRIQDDEARERWSRDGRHLWDIYMPETNDLDMTVERLTELTQSALDKRINSVIMYEADTASIEHIFGYEHEKIRLGDYTRVKDTSFIPPLYLDARVVTIERSVSDASQKKYFLGDFIEYSEDEIMATFKHLRAILARKINEGNVREITYDKGEIDRRDEDTYNRGTDYSDDRAKEAEDKAKDYVDEKTEGITEDVKEQMSQFYEKKIYRGGTTPQSPDPYDLWLDESSNPPVWKRFVGGQWVKFTRTNMSELQGQVVESQIANQAIVSRALADVAVTMNKIANGAVGTEKLAAFAVVADKIMANAVTAGKIAANAITAREIKAGTITALEIAAGTITTDLISAAGIDAGVIKAGILSGVTLDLDTDARIGRYLYVGRNHSNHNQENGIFLATGTSIRAVNQDLMLSSIRSTRIGGSNAYVNTNQLTGEVTIFGQANAKLETGMQIWGNLTKTTSERGYCGVGGHDFRSGGSVAGQGVNFKVNKTYTPSSISFTLNNRSHTNLTPSVFHIAQEGFFFGLEGQGSNTYMFWRGWYQA